MRHLIDIVSTLTESTVTPYGESPTTRFDRKPDYVLRYDDGEMEGNVWKNPTVTTFGRCIGPGRGSARGLITQDGSLYIWDAVSMFHDDVWSPLGLTNFLSVMFFNDEVCVKNGGWEEDDPVPIADDPNIAEYEPLIRGIRVLNQFYGPDFKIVGENWG